MNNPSEQRAYAQVDRALRTAPVAAPPRTLAPAIMARVRALAVPKPRFTLTWLDFALPLFATVMFVVFFTLWFNWPAQSAEVAAQQFRWVGLALFGPLTALASGPILFVSVAAIAATVVTVMLLLRSPEVTLK